MLLTHKRLSHIRSSKKAMFYPFFRKFMNDEAYAGRATHAI
jgi:hypothetical protein